MDHFVTDGWVIYGDTQSTPERHRGYQTGDYLRVAQSLIIFYCSKEIWENIKRHIL